VSGQFYPKSPSTLRLAVERFLQDALPASPPAPLALVVPHAGYIYSGQICADGYNQVRDQRCELVVILGTNHTAPDLRKVALFPGRGFQTPLGTASVDGEVVSALLQASGDCKAERGPHAREHSVEVQIPFIQVLFPQARIVPAIVGSSDIAVCSRFGAALAGILKGRRALIVASSDLSHYPDAEAAERVDRMTLKAIASLDPEALRAAAGQQMARRIPNLGTCACGEAPIMAAMAAAKALGATAGRVVSYAHSGDLPIGERDRVVGYGCVAFVPGAQEEDPPAPGGRSPEAEGLSQADKTALLALARGTIDRYLSTQTVPLPRGFSPAAMLPRGVFVTLHKRGQLRGCIGHMVADRPLAAQVAAMALQAAFEDPRFPSVTQAELPGLEIEISVLTPMQPVSGPEAIVVGRHGVLLKKGGRSAVFLPQVATEQGWGREEMLDHLSMKAGLQAGAWKDGAQFHTFEALVFGEGDRP
jgi:hypothetical protein